MPGFFSRVLGRLLRAGAPDSAAALRPVLESLRDSSEKLAQGIKTLTARQKCTDQVVRRLTDEQKALRLLLQSRQAGVTNEREPVLGGDALPWSLADDDRPATGSAPDNGGPASVPAPDVEMVALEQCPVCDAQPRTLVCEYNRLVLLDVETDERLKRYDYSLCHRCGVVYAARRPAGKTFLDLLDRFEDNLGRTTQNKASRPLLNTTALDPAQKEALARRLDKGPFVSSHLSLTAKDYVPQLLRDRLANSAHVEIIGSLLNPTGARVLEIRPRLGSILAGLQRLYGAEVHGLPMTDTQRFVMDRAYGITAPALLDFEHFTIPMEGAFDVIVSNHMVTHALRPGAFLRTLRSRLVKGGHIYLYNEPDDVEFLGEAASMINTLNPFHMQAFDRGSLMRALEVNGFETVFVTKIEGNFVVLARATEGAGDGAMSSEELEVRRQAYLTARDAAVLRTPESQRWRFRDEWGQIVERAVAGGVATFDDNARLRIVRRPSRAAVDSD